ncbi:MAG: hypothetical protein ABL931_04185 [Usitatibacteraceae bacterium]
MKRLFISIITISISVGAYAASESSSGSAQANPQTSSTLYCWKERLHVDGDELLCNWAESTREACEATKRTNISKSAVVSEPTTVKRCNNGQWLVQVTKK